MNGHNQEVASAQFLGLKKQKPITCIEAWIKEAHYTNYTSSQNSVKYMLTIIARKNIQAYHFTSLCDCVCSPLAAKLASYNILENDHTTLNIGFYYTYIDPLPK